MKKFLNKRKESFKNRWASKVVMLIIFALFHLGVISWDTSMVLCVIDILIVDELVAGLREAFSKVILEAIEEIETENQNK